MCAQDGLKIKSSLAYFGLGYDEAEVNLLCLPCWYGVRMYSYSGGLSMDYERSRIDLFLARSKQYLFAFVLYKRRELKAKEMDSRLRHSGMT